MVVGAGNKFQKACMSCRNPQHQARPSFKTMSQDYLKQPSARLLYWSPEDDNLSSKVGVCGAPLEEAQYLHENLQKSYNHEQIF